MSQYPPLLQRLIAALTRLPSVGPKTAERLAFYLLARPTAELGELADIIAALKTDIKRCSSCHNYSASDPCHICGDQSRDQKLLCVVSGHTDLEAIEKTKQYRGRYFVLNGLLQPIQGLGPDEIGTPELMKRIKDSRPPVAEVILAFNADINGETTVLYLKKLLDSLPLAVTRLARGLPVGADLEYADEITLSEALNNRREVK